ALVTYLCESSNLDGTEANDYCLESPRNSYPLGREQVRLFPGEANPPPTENVPAAHTSPNQSLTRDHASKLLQGVLAKKTSSAEFEFEVAKPRIVDSIIEMEKQWYLSLGYY
ncbi:hypothetical protein JTE90_014876, partial [Oedothorax gibbosus]